MADVKIELKSVENQVAELEVVKRKAEYLTKQRIVQEQQAKEMKALEKKVEAEIAPTKKTN